MFVFASLLNSSSNIAMTPFRHLPLGRALLLLCVPLCSIGKIHVTLRSFLSFSLWRSYISPLCFFKLLGFPIPVTSPSLEASISPQGVRDSSPTRIRNQPSPRRRQTNSRSTFVDLVVDMMRSREPSPTPSHLTHPITNRLIPSVYLSIYLRLPLAWTTLR